jgi:hypothetical protein
VKILITDPLRYEKRDIFDRFIKIHKIINGKIAKIIIRLDEIRYYEADHIIVNFYKISKNKDR